LVEQSEVLSELIHVKSAPVRANQSPDILKVLPAARVVDPALKLQCDQSLGAHNAQSTEGCYQWASRLQKLPRGRPVCVQKIQALIIPQVVGCVGTSMQASVSEGRHCVINGISEISIDEQIDILGCSNDFVRSQCQSAYESEPDTCSVQGGDRFLELFT
jgi:hypothetical protein